MRFGFTGGHAIVVEPMTITRAYPAQWSKATIDLTELARLRFEEKWSIKRIQEHFGFCSTKITLESARRLLGPIGIGHLETESRTAARTARLAEVACQLLILTSWQEKLLFSARLTRIMSVLVPIIAIGSTFHYLPFGKFLRGVCLRRKTSLTVSIMLLYLWVITSIFSCGRQNPISGNA